MRVEQHSLNVLDFSVILKCALVESLLFAESCNFRLVIEFPYLHLQNTLDNLRSNHDVDLQHFCLIISVLGSVLTHAVEQQRSKLLNSVALQEQVSDLMNIQVFVALIQLLCESQCSFGIDINHTSQLFCVVDFEANLLAIIRSLLKTTLFIENLHNLGVGLRLLINF